MSGPGNRRSWREDRDREERLLALMAERGAMTSLALWQASDTDDDWSLEAVQMRFTKWRRAGVIAASAKLGAPFYTVTGEPLEDFEAINRRRVAKIRAHAIALNKSRAGHHKSNKAPQRLTGVAGWLSV
jgi:hypothetical protein